MGLFDSIVHPCPDCGGKLEWQTKIRDNWSVHDPWEMKDFSLENAPLLVLADCHDEFTRCRDCKHLWRMNVTAQATIKKVE